MDPELHYQESPSGIHPSPGFTSQEPKVGDPPLGWDDFRNPQLRRLPLCQDIRLGRLLGGGVDGRVLKARIKGREDPVAVKIFHVNQRQPPPQPQPLTVNPLYAQHTHLFSSYRAPPAWPETYWAFERECINCALLEKMEASLQRAAAGEPIYVNPNPKMMDEALENLRAFSDEGRPGEPIPGFSPLQQDVQVNRCLGWTDFRGSDLNQHIKRTRAMTPADFKDETYYAIVYAYVSGCELEPDRIVAQMEFFHVAGFLNELFNARNWRGSGVLVDFSDIISPFERWFWRPSSYRMGKEMCRAFVETAVKRGHMPSTDKAPG